jgi:HTH-type transcriptional repressor of NAD biosynthesis genes
LLKVLPEPVEAMFGGEEDYAAPMAQYLPMMKYVLFDYKRSQYPISGTEIRRNPLMHWDYIPGAARPFFAKKILLTGTESVGKTTLAKYLAKIFHTPWSPPEVGRYYSSKHMGGNEAVFVPRDFDIIAYEQYLSDMDALRHANRFVFFDSDAVVTLYYARMYTQDPEDFPGVKRFIDPGRYDCVIMLTPDVPWVDDGLRFNSDEKLRWELHAKLMKMYEEYGFGGKIHTVSGGYCERLRQAVALVKAMEPK